MTPTTITKLTSTFKSVVPTQSTFSDRDSQTTTAFSNSISEDISQELVRITTSTSTYVNTDYSTTQYVTINQR